MPGNTSLYVEIGFGSVTDLVGNPFGGILNEYQWKFTTLSSGTGAPSISKVTLASPTKIQLVFDREMDASAVPYPASFFVTVNDAQGAREMDAVSISGNLVTLTLRSAIANGQKVTIAYTAPSEANALKSLAGTKVASFPGRDVVYDAANLQPRVTGGSVSGSYLMLQFSKPLDDSQGGSSAHSSAYTWGTAISVGGCGRKWLFAAAKARHTNL